MSSFVRLVDRREMLFLNSVFSFQATFSNRKVLEGQGKNGKQSNRRFLFARRTGTRQLETFSTTRSGRKFWKKERNEGNHEKRNAKTAVKLDNLVRFFFASLPVVFPPLPSRWVRYFHRERRSKLLLKNLRIQRNLHSRILESISIVV